MNVIDFASKKAERDKKSKDVVNNQLTQSIESSQTTNSRIGVPDGVDPLFFAEMVNFRFQNMKPPAAFVIMNTDNLPPAFPPDPPPLMAA